MNTADSTVRLNVLLGDSFAGCLSHDAPNNRFAFSYHPGWLQSPGAFPLGPCLPLQAAPNQSAELHSATVRHFFENLLPEGQALDDAASASYLAKSNLMGLMLALGGETSGAIRLCRADQAVASEPVVAVRRLLPQQELSRRIRARPWQPFSVWDGKVRLSIAGFQDKIAVLKEGDTWFFVEGSELASTVILKPEPGNPELPGLVSNEFFCMKLAETTGLPVARVNLLHVPEPVLEVARFDRLWQGQRIHRLHVFDGCQALGISPALKYERPYGDGETVRHIRDGASLPRLFQLLDASKNPAAQRLQLLRWVLFQVLIGNTDAHAKNLSFFCDAAGYALTPAYDLLSIPACGQTRLADSYAMAIGDAFRAQELSAFEWAHFAFTCKLPPALVARELKKMLTRIQAALPACRAMAQKAGADEGMVERVCEVVQSQCAWKESIVAQIVRVDQGLF